MKTYTYKDSPVRIFGLAEFEKNGRLTRLPDEVIEQVPSLSHYGRRCPGARLCFRTNSRRFTVRIVFETLSVDVGMSIYNCQSAFVFAGEKSTCRYLGIVHPTSYDNKDFSAVIDKGNGEMEDVIVWLPRNEILANVEISVEDNADISEPTPYKYSTPVVYYGSSITEGGCSCNVSNGYNAILSRLLDTDYLSFGFSGSAKGETPIVDYIREIEMSVFVYDYDHNAPNTDHLEKTHEPFFLRFREKQPDTPVVMMTRPKIAYTEEEKRRREIVLKTYNNAVNRGDKNVYFIDGETFYGENDRDLCTVDGIHPNDLGFYRMALTILPVLKNLLEDHRSGNGLDAVNSREINNNALMDVFKSHPAIYAVGREYQIAVVTSCETLMWVRVGESEFYDESNGILRSARPLHFMSVPMDLLNEVKEYTVCYRKVIDRKAYYSETSEVFETTYKFYPIGDGDIRIYHISDAHDKIEAPVSAGLYFGASPDLLVLNGDIRNHSDNPESLYAIHEIAGRITGGEHPTVFSRGNHDTRGKYAEKFADYTPTDRGVSYFTFRLGCLWGIVMDCGEDKRDPQIEYGNTICCHAFRLRETEFLKRVIQNAENEYKADGVTKRMVICHIPFTYTMRPPFDIEQELYREWTRLIGENINPDFYLCGHMHELAIWYPGGDHDCKGQSCPVIVGGTPVTYDGDEYIGCAIEYGAETVKVAFTDKDKNVVGTDEIRL